MHLVCITKSKNSMSLLDLPWEMVTEILSRSALIDRFNISRVCKTFVTIIEKFIITIDDLGDLERAVLDGDILSLLTYKNFTYSYIHKIIYLAYQGGHLQLIKFLRHYCDTRILAGAARLPLNAINSASLGGHLALVKLLMPEFLKIDLEDYEKDTQVLASGQNLRYESRYATSDTKISTTSSNWKRISPKSSQPIINARYGTTHLDPYSITSEENWFSLLCSACRGGNLLVIQEVIGSYYIEDTTNHANNEESRLHTLNALLEPRLISNIRIRELNFPRAMYAVCLSGNLDSIKFIANICQSINGGVDWRGNMRYAFQSGNMEVINYVFNKTQLQLSDDNTSLQHYITVWGHSSVESGNISALEFLIKLNDVMTGSKISILDVFSWACRTGHLNMIEFINTHPDNFNTPRFHYGHGGEYQTMTMNKFIVNRDIDAAPAGDSTIVPNSQPVSETSFLESWWCTRIVDAIENNRLKVLKYLLTPGSGLSGYTFTSLPSGFITTNILHNSKIMQAKGYHNIANTVFKYITQNNL